MTVDPEIVKEDYYHSHLINLGVEPPAGDEPAELLVHVLLGHSECIWGQARVRATLAVRVTLPAM